MAEVDRESLKCNVNVILHCAATVRFDTSPIGLSDAIKINVRGLKEVITLAREMSGLAPFVHVSSAYVHCHIQGEVIQEKIYPSEKHTVQDVLKMCEEIPSEKLTREMIGERPNTCHFSKAMAEQLLKEECGTLPISVVRPTIVMGALKEPMPGWAVNMDTVTCK